MVAVHKALLAAAAAQYAGYSAPASYSGSPENGSVINGFDWGLNHFPWRTAAISGCPLTIEFNPHFPPDQTQLVKPTKLPQFLGLAFGVQNYTCSNTNTYTYVACPWSSCRAVILITPRISQEHWRSCRAHRRLLHCRRARVCHYSARPVQLLD